MNDFSGRRKGNVLMMLPFLSLILGLTPNCKGSGDNHKKFGGALPASAGDIHEQDVDMFPDWEYYLRATMPRKDCEALLVKVSTEEHLRPVAEHQWLDGKGDWGPGNPPVWWKPTWVGGHQHGHNRDVNTCAMCRDGLFYYWTGSH